MDGSIGKSMLNQIAGSMGNFSGEQMKQAENIWKMLDDMSENNPDGYKSFVKNNLENGMEDMKKEKEQKLASAMVKPNPLFLLKALALLKSTKIPVEEKPAFKALEGLRIPSADQVKVESLKKSLDKEVRVYVNVLGSDRVRKPLDGSGKEVDEVEKKFGDWSVIPYSVQEATQRKSASIGRMNYFFDFVMNDVVLQQMSSSPVLSEQLVTFVIGKLGNCLKQHRNPLLKMYDFMQAEEVLYYQIERMSIVKHKTKKFKLVDMKKRISIFPDVLLEPEADSNVDFEKIKQQQRDAKNFANASSGQDEKERTESSKPIADVSDLRTKQHEMKMTQEGNDESVLDGLRIVQKGEKPAAPKKVLIEEIPIESETKPNKVSTTEQEQEAVLVLEKPWFTMCELTASIAIEIMLPKVTSILEIILDVSDSTVSLEAPLVYSLKIALPMSVKTDNIAPKWNKKNKTLKLNLFKTS